LEPEPPLPFFATDEFLTTLAETRSPGARPTVVECEGLRFRTLVRNGRALRPPWPMGYYLSPLDLPAEVHVPFVFHAVRDLTPAGIPRPPDRSPAAFVRWEGFESFEAYQRFRKTTLHGRASSLARDRRYLERDHGKLSFVTDDSSALLLEQIIALKAEQLERRFGRHYLAHQNNRDLYREFFRRGLLRAAALHADGRLVAGGLYLRWHGTCIFRTTVYDPQFAKYSPGMLLIEDLLRFSFESGDREFDLLLGNQPYKWHFATHVRWLGNLGNEPLRDRLALQARIRLGPLLSPRPVHSTYERLLRLAGRGR
jgi:hypothetical protein